MVNSFARLFGRIFVYPWPIQGEPLIQCLVDHVVAEVVYNCLLSVKANPLLCESSPALEEAASITEGIYLNLGHMPHQDDQCHQKTVKLANKLHIPIVIDLMGAATLASRNVFAQALKLEIPSVIKGNYSEILKYCNLSEHIRGLHSPKSDQTIEKQERLVAALKEKTVAYPQTTFVVTGKTDLIVNRHYALSLENGSDWQKNFAGAGSAVGAIIAALMGEGLEPLEASILAISYFNRCGEIARSSLKEHEGYMIFRLNLLDQLSILRDHPDWPTAIRGQILNGPDR